MLRDYLMPVFWAIVITIVFYPLHLKIAARLPHRPSLASLLSIATVILIVVIPLSVIGSMVVQESLSAYQKITSEGSGLDNLGLLERAETIAGYLEPYGLSKETLTTKLQEWAAAGSQALSSSLLSLSQFTFSFVVGVAITFYLLFFFFRDAKTLLETLLHYLPLGNAYERRLLNRFTETTRAVVKGTLAIALLQGFLGGLTFWLTGVSSPVLWGVVMAFLAILPAIGPALVWVPAGIILIWTGSIWEGVTILVVGSLLVSVVDEFLRPILVGRGSKMPDAIILLSTIGGLATFGISGFVVGPIIAAFFLSLWIMFEEKYRQELQNNN